MGDFDLAAKRFLISDIAAASFAQVATLRSWVQRGHFVLGARDAAAETDGVPHLLSGYTALQMFLAVELNRRGVPIADAAKAAMWFVHTGTTPGGWEQDSSFHTEPERNPGELYKDAKDTLLIVPSNPDRTKVIPIYEDTKAVDLRTEILSADNYADVASVIFFLDGPVTTFLRRLDMVASRRRK